MRTAIAKAGRLLIPKALWDRLGLRPGPVEVAADATVLGVEPVVGDELEERDGLLRIPASGVPRTDDEVDAFRHADQA